MKRIILLLVVTFTMACGFAQNRSKTESMKEMREMTDSLTDEQKDALFALTEDIVGQSGLYHEHGYVYEGSRPDGFNTGQLEEFYGS